MPFFVVIEAPQLPREPEVLGPFAEREHALNEALIAVERVHHDIRDLVEEWDDIEDDDELLDAYNDWARGNDSERIVIGRASARQR